MPKGATDTQWLPSSAELGSTRIPTRDKRIRNRPLERVALLGHNVRACFLTSGGRLDLFDQLQLWLRYWPEIERLVADEPGPWLASVTRNGVRLFDKPAED